MIDLAVADRVVGRLAETSVEELRGLADAACGCACRGPPDLAALSRASGALQERFVALLGNAVTADFHRRPRIETLWLRALRHHDSPWYIDPRYLRDLVGACVRGDAEALTRIVLDPRT